MRYEPRGILSLARARKRQDGERGQILVLFAVVMVLLMGLAAIVVDVGLLRTDGARLQNALDASALAAAHSLPANSTNVALVKSTAATFAQRNFPGIAAPATTFACLIGIDAAGLPRVTDMPAICNVSFAAGNAAWRCTGVVCWAPCNPSAVSTDICNTVIVADSAVRPYAFGRAVGVNSGSTGTLQSAACTGACGGPPTTPVDVMLVLDRTLSMAGDESNLRNAAFAVLQAYDPKIQHVGLAMLGPSSEITVCAGGGYGEPLVNGTLTAPSYQSGTSGSNVTGGATTLDIGKPSGTGTGELLVAGITFNGGTGLGTISAPSGWHLIARTDSGTNVGQATYYKVATASEPATYTWTFSASKRASGGITLFAGVDTADPIDRSSTNSGTTGTTFTASSVTTTKAQTTLVGFFGSNTGTAITPSGTSALTEQFDVSNPNASGPRTEGSSRTQSAAGATGARTATGGNGAWVAQLIALNAVPVESYNISYPVTPYPASLNKWIPVGLSGTSDAVVNVPYLNADGSLNAASPLVKSINCIQPNHLYMGTDLATPMDFAWKYLRDHQRSGVKTGIIFETDGTPQTQNFTCAQATTAADAAKAAGIEVFTIGFSLTGTSSSAPKCPDNSSRTALTQLASMATSSSSVSATQCDANENTDGDHFFCQPAGADLTAVFRAAAVALSGGSRLVQLYPQPVVASVSPNTNGPKAGGQSVTITGKYFTEAYDVAFGGSSAATFHIVSDTQIVAVSPPGTANATVDIQVSTSGGSSKVVSVDQYTYGP